MDPETSIRLRPKNVRTCYVCGPDNACGLQVAFLADGAHGSRALYTARPEHEGWPGLLHGGVTFSLMDEALGWAVHFQGLHGVTARIDTRFRRPIPIGMPVVIKAWTIDQRRRIATARAVPALWRCTFPREASYILSGSPARIGSIIGDAGG
jgi:acyl-coenzyme A thioesterase PaaI-like protein